MTDAIYMEPEEYEAFLKKREDQKKDAKKPLGSTTFYALNQNIINQMPILSKSARKQSQKNFSKWFKQYDFNQEKYYLLLCKELNYYTIFHLNSDSSEIFWNEILDMENYIGKFKVAEEDTNGCFAVWADWQNGGTSHCFYLFPYTQGVVEVD